jgi:hypothetical protein
MRIGTHWLLLVSVFLNCSAIFAQPINEAKIKLIENQRNLIHLRNEKLAFQAELAALLEAPSNNDQTAAEGDELRELITLTETIIQNVAQTVSHQRLLIATLEKGSPPSALDIALNKALSADLTALARNMPESEAAQREITLLRSLLKQEARIGAQRSSQGNVSVAREQQVAEQEFLNLLALFSGGTADEAADKPLKIAGLSREGTYQSETVLSYLGHNQYHTETEVQAGEMTFTIDDQPWRITIPEQDNDAMYIVIYDVRNRDKPRLVMFNKALLLQ